MKRGLLIITIIMISALDAGADIRRISGVAINTGEVMKLYVAPKLVSTIQAPCPVLEVPLGSDKEIKVEISKKNNTRVFVWLQKGKAEPTNLQLYCPTGAPLVFDVVPSEVTHQDYLRVVAMYGGPEIQMMGSEKK